MSLPELPISPSLPQIRARLEHEHLVLGAPPGSGKTTLVPLALLEAHWLKGKKIIMLEPRRPAARMAAHRMSLLLGEQVGQTVGYQVRFERHIGDNTRIEVLTEGLLLRRLQRDPELADVGLVIFDEFHERSLAGDLSLALCLDVANSIREDLRLLPMSASLEDDTLAPLLGGQHLEVEGRSWPVKIHYLDHDPAPEDRLRDISALIHKALQSHAGDILVFLPGKGEINRLDTLLADHLPTGVIVQQLHGDIPPAQQDAIIRGEGNQRRIILSTDIAETSLTIEGIEVVIDSGLNRKPRFDPRSGLTRLDTGFISQSSALQRAGRAGRLGPGHCYRAWSEAKQQRLEVAVQPEIQSADLASTVLELAAWGIGEVTQLRWPTAPPAAHWNQARELLQQLQALDTAGRITTTGQAILKLPVHPRVAHMLVAMQGKNKRRLGADIAALLSERDPVPTDTRVSLGVDIRYRLDALQAFREGREPDGFEPHRLRRINQVAKQLWRLIPEQADQHIATAANISAGEALALAFPDRIAMARSSTSPVYLLRNGRAASLDPHDPLTGQEFLVAAALDAGSIQGRIWLAAPITRAQLEALFSNQITVQRELCWDDQLAAVRVVCRRQLGALTLSQHNERVDPTEDVSRLLLAYIRKQGLEIFEQAPKLRRLQAKLTLLQEAATDQDWPELSDTVLLGHLQAWLLPWLDGISTLKQLRTVDIMAALQTFLGWETVQKIEQLLPDDYITPAGIRRSIDYPPDALPFLRVPLQEMLGERQTPHLAEGRIPLTLHLLSPAMRPLQITRDLEHFWEYAYKEVRKEMRGRYPKHHWPEDPLNAHATRLGRRIRNH